MRGTQGTALFRLLRRGQESSSLAFAVLGGERFSLPRDVGPVFRADGRAFDFGENAGKVFQAGDRGACAVVEQCRVLPGDAEDDGTFDGRDRNSLALPVMREFLVCCGENAGYTRVAEEGSLDGGDKRGPTVCFLDGGTFVRPEAVPDQDAFADDAADVETNQVIYVPKDVGRRLIEHVRERLWVEW